MNMLLIQIFFACVRRWGHSLYRFVLFDFAHRECSATTCTNGVFSLKIYCSCGKIFGEWKTK